MKKIFLLSLLSVICLKAQQEYRMTDLTEEVISQMGPLDRWYQSATGGEKKQLDHLLTELFSYINDITATADKSHLNDLAGAIRILTGMNDLEFTLSIQMGIDQKD